MRILKVKPRSIDYTGPNPSLCFVMARRFRNNRYTHVKCQGDLYRGRCLESMGWKGDIESVRQIVWLKEVEND